MSLPNTLYTAEQIKMIEQYAIDECDIAGFKLMQDAGKACFEKILKHYPDCQSMCVVCGTGNNGGDGFIVAELALQANLNVTLVQLGNPDSISGDALLAKAKWHKSGGVSFNYDKKLFSTYLDTDLIIDAIFGTGLNRNVSGDYLEVIESINAVSNISAKTNVIAIDIPSGLAANTGVIFGNCIQADHTVTFVGLKQGLFTGKARDNTGEIHFDSLSIPNKCYEQLEITHPIKLIPDDILQQHLTPRAQCSHKGHFGHVLLIGGDEGMSGAIRLAAEAALRCGAGLVSVATHTSHSAILNIGRPEIMVHGVLQASSLKPLMGKATVIVLGPGLGLSEWSRSLFSASLETDLPVVLDADALNLLAEQNHQIELKENWVITPHPKEMSRLLKTSTDEIETDRFKSNNECVQTKGCKSGGVSILKGAGTLISNKHFTLVCNKGNPGMATGGMGDVLSGIIAAMLAQGLSLFDAANTGVYLHATAADIAAKDGERGMLASDLFPHLRNLINNRV